MRRKWRIHGLRIAAFGSLGIAAAGAVTMALWNALLPAIMSMPRISFWQALGLMLLSRLLFGGFRGGCGRGWRRGPWPRFTADMTPEERDRLRQELRDKCHAPAPETRT
jgi:hypothetical protein